MGQSFRFNKKQEVALWLFTLIASGLVAIQGQPLVALAMVAAIVVFSLRDRPRAAALGVESAVRPRSEWPHISVVVAIGTALAAVTAHASGGVWPWESSQAAGYLLGGMLIPLALGVVAYRTRGRKWTTFAVWFLGTIVALALLHVLAESGRETSSPSLGEVQPSSNASVVPPESPVQSATLASSNGNRRGDPKDVVAEFYQEAQQILAEHNAATEAIDSSQWMTALSLYDPELNRNTRQNMLQYLRIRENYVTRHKALMDGMPERAARHLSGDQLHDFLVGWRKGLMRSEMIPQADRALDAERQWIGAAVQLYNFADKYRRTMNIEADGVTFADTAMNEQFIRLAEKTDETQEIAVHESEKLEKMRAEMGRKLGLSGFGPPQQ